MPLTFTDDPFGANRMVAIRIVSHLLEAWTPERKEEIVRAMAERNADLVDHVTVGDYDLVLWHYRSPLDLYAASFNSGQEDPTTLDGQKRQPKAKYVAWYDVVSCLRTWTRAHGRILIGSTQTGRTAQYRRLLNRHFLTAEWSDYPEAGFFILPD